MCGNGEKGWYFLELIMGKVAPKKICPLVGPGKAKIRANFLCSNPAISDQNWTGPKNKLKSCFCFENRAGFGRTTGQKNMPKPVQKSDWAGPVDWAGVEQL